MSAKNKVIAGDYKGGRVSGGWATCINYGREIILLDKNNVDDYSLITEDIRKSAASGIARGVVGGALLGPVGLLAGGLSAKNKGVYQLAIQFKDGKKSLLEVDEKVYKSIVKSCF